MKLNPYPEKIQDEASGIMVENIKHKAWEEGYIACNQKWKNGIEKEARVYKIAPDLMQITMTVSDW